jgi:SAM-dependent methyltransferase
VSMAFSLQPAASADVDYDTLYRTSDEPVEYGLSYAEAATGTGSSLRKFILSQVHPAGSKTLVLGGGTSELGLAMWRDGFKNVTNVDASAVAIDTMSRKHSEYQGLEYLVRDITDLSGFSDAAFDLVVEKMTLETLSEDAIQRAVAEAFRLLSRGGLLLSIGMAGVDLSRPKDRALRRIFGPAHCHAEWLGLAIADFHVCRKPPHTTQSKTEL